MLSFVQENQAKHAVGFLWVGDGWCTLIVMTLFSVLQLYMVVPKGLPAMPLVRAISNMYVDSDGTWDDDQAQQYFSDIITDCVYVAPAVGTADALNG